MITASFESSLVNCGRAAIFCRGPNASLSAQSAPMVARSSKLKEELYQPRAFTPRFQPAFNALKRRKKSSPGINSGIYLTGGNSSELYYC